MTKVLLFLLAIGCTACTTTLAQLPPLFDHVVIVVEENHSYEQISGDIVNAPFINMLATNGAAFTNAHGIEHPSQPNYLDLFSGSNQGVTDNTTSSGTPFSVSNLGAALRTNGYTFTGYSETLPAVGFTGDFFSTVNGQNQYVRKHNPWVNWQDDTLPTPTNRLPSAVNQPFSAFPSDFTLLPTVAFVVPNEQHDMHDGSVATADAWLNTNLGGYGTWAKQHNSLLIVAWDEDDNSSGNHVPLIFYGAQVKTGMYGENTDHFMLLRTVEDMYGLPYAGASASATAITDAFVTPEPGRSALAGALGLALLGFLRRRGLSSE